MNTLEQLQLDNSYARLPDIFYSRHHPQPLSGSHLVHFNHAAAQLIGLDPGEAAREEFLEFASGARLLPESQPLALCYAGHQFGQYVPRLGDGRALLLTEVLAADGGKWDLQLKGSGPTLYSRGGDGRAVLRSTIREYLCSEAMHGLGIPTTRALCMTASQEEVYREQIETGAMLIRMAPSHVRFGSFEYFYYEQRYDDLATLTSYVVEQHFAHLVDTDNPALSLLREAIARTAELIAHWQAVGFAHGVMNTDNMSILGMTLDYGPYGFLDSYDPGFICNHSDHSGRYAFDQQPAIGLFNLSCLAQALLPLIDDEPQAAAEAARAELDNYRQQFTDAYAAHMRAKLGLHEARADDKQLVEELLDIMHAAQADYTLLFRSLSLADENRAETAAGALFTDPAAWHAWLARYRSRLAAEGSNAAERSQAMRAVNPRYVLRNHLAETAIRKASDDADYSEIDRLMGLLQKPFDDHPGMDDYAGAPPSWASGISVSCSS